MFPVLNILQHQPHKQQFLFFWNRRRTSDALSSGQSQSVSTFYMKWRFGGGGPRRELLPAPAAVFNNHIRGRAYKKIWQKRTKLWHFISLFSFLKRIILFFFCFVSKTTRGEREFLECIKSTYYDEASSRFLWFDYSRKKKEKKTGSNTYKCRRVSVTWLSPVSGLLDPCWVWYFYRNSDDDDNQLIKYISFIPPPQKKRAIPAPSGWRLWLLLTVRSWR